MPEDNAVLSKVFVKRRSMYLKHGNYCWGFGGLTIR